MYDRTFECYFSLQGLNQLWTRWLEGWLYYDNIQETGHEIINQPDFVNLWSVFRQHYSDCITWRIFLLGMIRALYFWICCVKHIVPYKEAISQCE